MIAVVSSDAKKVTQRTALVTRTQAGLRCAMIISETPLRVRWEDTGQEETFIDLPEDSQLVPEGTLLYRSVTDQPGVIEDLARPDGGLRIVCAVLQESGRILSVPEVKDLLVSQYALPREVVDKNLKTVETKLQKDSRISVHREVDPTNDDAQDQSSAKTSRKSVKTSTIRFKWVGSDAPHELDQQTPPEAGSQSGLSCADDRTEGSAARTLRELLRLDPLHAPIRVGEFSVAVAAQALQEIDEKELAVLCDRFEKAQRWDLASVLLATPRASKAIRTLVQNWDQDSPADAVLGQALTWIVSGAEPDNSIRVVEATGRHGLNVSRPVVAACLECLVRPPAALVPGLLHVLASAAPPRLVEAVSDVDAAAALKTSADRPLAERSQLLWACWRADPSMVHERRLWPSPFEVKELEAWADRSPECLMLEDRWLQEQVVLPVIRAYIRDADRRLGIGRILSWPAALFDLVGANEIVGAVRRVATSDPSLGHVVVVLAQEDRLGRLEAELNDLRETSTRAVEAADQARSDMQAALRAQEAAFVRASEAEQAQLQASTGEIRQAHIDALRAVADVLATLGRLGGSGTAADALQDALTAAARHGVRAIGSSNAVVPYDNSRHECLGPLNSESVLIKEIGFEFDDFDGPVILRRAAVVSHAP